ncbi:heterokaryon incompatibility protein-domain-containing protein [Fomes fomentarius]|nr:heterokaryon incompatibility protein-domain-containing protein [Fomes fomentarius]
MWLLNTSSGKLVSFKGPSEVKYAILSHCWRDKEQTFQDVQRLGDSESVFSDGYASKICDCCLYARQEGYEWVWIDTCCIDKTSSAELSEAINSMFAWYAEAEVCYAYLDDVPGMDTRGAREDDSLFRKSRWWTRGWTVYIRNPLHYVSPYEAHYCPRNPALVKRETFELIFVLVRALQVSHDHKTRLYHILSFEDAIVLPLMITLNLMATTRSAAIATCAFGSIYSTISALRSGVHWLVLGNVLEFFRHDDRYEDNLIWGMCVIRLSFPTFAIICLVPWDVLRDSKC